MKVVAFKAVEKNSLRAFLSLQLASGLTIHGCSLHQKGDREWVALPTRPWTTNDGAQRWSPVVELSDESRASFQRQAIEAIRTYLNRNQGAA